MKKIFYLSKKLSNIFIFYFISIVFFGTIYYAYWLFYPDSFIIEEQLNNLPFTEKFTEKGEFKNLSFYQKKVDSINNEIRVINTQISLRSKERDSLKTQLDTVSDRNQELLLENQNLFIQSSLDANKLDTIRSLSQVLSFLEKDDSNNLVIAKLKVQLALLNSDVAKQKVALYQHILDNFSHFKDTLISNKMEEISRNYSDVEFDILPKLNLSLNQLYFSLQDQKYDALSNYHKRINYWDFLLLSSSNSSTVTYGELIPNHKTVRLMFFIQAILCIFLLTKAIDKI